MCETGCSVSVSPVPVGLIVGIVTVVGLFLLALAFVGALKREKLQAW